MYNVQCTQINVGLKTPSSSLTLKQIAEVARIKFSGGKKVPDKLRKRQDDVINYWERKVDENDLNISL